MRAFDLRTGALSQNLPNFNAGTAEIFVVVLERTGNADITIDSGPNSADVSNDVGNPQGWTCRMRSAAISPTAQLR